MDRTIAVVGAPSNIGLQPYDDGEARHVDWAPHVLRRRDLVRRIGAIDLGDAVPPPYRDYVRMPFHARNERQILSYSRTLGQRVALAGEHGRFGVVLGGDCSIVLGCLVGARRATNGAVGLVYVDAHADFATIEDSPTGSAAGMTVAFATGRGASTLARLSGRSPLVEDRHVALLGRRDGDRSPAGSSREASAAILDLNHSAVVADCQYAVSTTTARVASAETAGFCIHVDVDVLDPRIMPAVSSPIPDGLSVDRLVGLLAPFVANPKAMSIDFAGYDPALDPDRSCARLLVNLVEALFAASENIRRQLSAAAAGATSSTAASTA
jgi:arginase